ncbi:hypothetical protein [Campylobacter sp. US33a]|uniref:Yip1 domain-containing protein n=1 Tax=Campylobacter sp. CCS1377 TaxID=3158229 RepID=A0AAU7E5I8_9BACT|nr:hypothetical protein [Campylobacter sp. US33a]MCW1360001.1 hypothetical protein [Campylobacter jejuni]TEY02464.1 hypothetical protein ELQ16_06220 [Campylobacter sp. US33a]
MQIPIYSKLKAKLENKGIDNISSGQIAWFVCSLILALIGCVFVFFKTIYENDENLFLAISNLSMLKVFVLIIYFCIPFNLLYIYNAIPLVLSAVFISLIIYFSSLSLFVISLCGIGVLFLISIFKRKLMFSVLLFVMGYVCSSFLLQAIALFGGFSK